MLVKLKATSRTRTPSDLMAVVVLPVMVMVMVRCQTTPATPPSRPALKHKTCLVRETSSRRCYFDAQLKLGEVRGTTWVYGLDSLRPALAHLARDGSLRTYPIPFSSEVAALVGERVWFLLSHPPRLVTVDLAAPGRPRIGPEQPLFDLPPKRALRSLATDGQRVLIVSTDYARSRHHAAVWDVSTGRRIGAEVQLGRYFEIEKAWCQQRSCAVVGVAGDGRARRVRVFGFDSQGHGWSEQLSTQHTLSVAVHAGRQGATVAWSVRDAQVFTRQLAPTGRPTGAEVVVVEPSKHTVFGLRLVAGGDRVYLALRYHTSPWRLLALPLRGAQPGGWAVLLPNSNQLDFDHGTVTGGVVVVTGGAKTAHSSDTTYPFSSWTFHGSAAFIDPGGKVSSVQLPEDSGPGDGSHDLFLLTRPEGASLIIAPRSDATDGWLVSLLVPCPP